MKTALKKLCIFHGQLEYEGKSTVYLVETNQPAPTVPGPWKLVKEVYVINSATRPIGTNMKLFEIMRSAAFPYNANSIFVVLDPYTHPPGENKEFFISYNFPVQNTIPIYIFRDLTDNSVFLSLEKDPPYPFLTKDYYQEFWVLDKPIEGWECIEGVVMPKKNGTSLFPTLKNCPTQTFSIPVDKVEKVGRNPLPALLIAFFAIISVSLLF